MTAAELLDYIPRTTLEDLSIEHQVDYQVKKLDGITMFQLLLYSFLTTRQNSYRVMEEFYHSFAFGELAGNVHQGVRYNSLRDRLVSINPNFFDAIFRFCYQKFQKELDKNQNIVLFDSTLVSASSKILQQGIRINKKGDKRYVKFSVGIKQIPIHVKVFTEQTYASEDTALFESIDSCELSPEDIVVFDRGISSRKVYDSLCVKKQQFVTRLNDHVRSDILEEYPIDEKENQGKLVFESDQKIKLYNRKHKPTKSYLRLIRCTQKDSKKPLTFLTNIESLSVSEVAAIYKQRWEIEVFFKFIKQQFNFSHLMSRNENGIKVVLYMTLISAILLTAYKRANHLKGYKIPKLKLANEIEKLIIRDIALKCGGDPDKINNYFNSS